VFGKSSASVSVGQFGGSQQRPGSAATGKNAHLMPGQSNQPTAFQGFNSNINA